MDYSQAFTDMASAIKHNADSSFGGAFCISPPEGAGEVISTLILDRQQDPILFWKSLMERAAATVSRLEELARSQSAFGIKR